MPRQRESVDSLLVKGKSHLTKEEIERRREAENSFRPPTDKVKCPTWLDKESKKIWKSLQEDLSNLGLLTNIDVVKLAIFCDSVSKYRDATAKINEQGLTIQYTNAAGATNPMKNPHISIANMYAAMIKQYGGLFGLSPAARLKLMAPPEDKKKDAFAEDFEEDDDD
ncbi:phage terminase small subunit P27 family [Tumebacillus permanentifrigoris]|uniref:P27 family predicted phage terminase small subunit n=1 Tax=Tumebacillus permanentifrigoris TaxID=378543 RepID=A0A316D308_9BACL|nr:phage terminase small subunit P27 family [Tumebacillus permanentifrigoris]PWK05311.1 P27 family predicted phage terminase small subunit [Tumebacillus permanentifrigoris]